GYALLEEKRSEALRERDSEIAEVRDAVHEHTQSQVAVNEEDAANARKAMDPGFLATMIRDQVLKPIRNQGRRE
ncbi:MAG TPA: hypothetical protein VJS64_17970, partial [Pyrinomonadaceae bacterium]|nr:hypothetical protein [Pyrinomonadaceae bacterium]